MITTCPDGPDRKLSFMCRDSAREKRGALRALLRRILYGLVERVG